MNTKEAIQKEFIQIYLKKEYKHITVKEVCANTPVARTTFYYYYQNIDEIINEIEDNLIGGILQIASNVSSGDVQNMDFSVFLTQTLDYIKDNWQELEAFLVVQPNMRFIIKWKEAIKKHFSLRFPEKNTMPNYELISETIASGVIGAYSYWLKNPEKVDVEKLKQIVVSMLDNTIRLL